MPHNYVPNPRHTQAGQAPQVGQSGEYEDKEGNRYPGQVVGTLGKLPNGNYGVVFRLLKPNASQLAADPSKLGDPAADEQNGWQWNPKDNTVYFCPHNPPDPTMVCP